MTVTNLHTVADYKSTRYNVVAQLEEVKVSAYFDTKGIITIGVGFNIEGDNRAIVMDAMGLSAAQQQAINSSWGSDRMRQIKSMPQNSTAEQNAKNSALQSYLASVLGGQKFDMTDGSDGSMRKAFDIIVTTHEEAVTAIIPSDSLEKISLVSMHYNSAALIDTGLKSGISNVDPFQARAEA